MIKLQIKVDNQHQAKFITELTERLRKYSTDGATTEAGIMTAMVEIQNFSERMQDTQTDIMDLTIGTATFMGNLYCHINDEVERARIRQSIMEPMKGGL